jgi:hypothetical protein
MRTEINDHIAFSDYASEIVTLINLPDHLELWISLGASHEHLPHAAF